MKKYAVKYIQNHFGLIANDFDSLEDAISEAEILKNDPAVSDFLDVWSYDDSEYPVDYKFLFNVV